MNYENNNITFEKNDIKFNFRVAGIAVDRGRVLLHTTADDDFWNLPGGRVEFNEATEDTLIREFYEELGVRIEINKLVYVNEDFFDYSGKKYHEIGFYYVIRLPEGQEIVNQKGEFKGIEDNGRLIFKWFAFEELKDMQIYPECLKTELSMIEEMKFTKHSIVRN
ncbi:NUDIX hydrolase [Paenibacillus sp. Marseille-Q4541]|uniref:NUDIX hydrolase n=1 Tax=Paenibacillus sp. Marseille-Q4541 TaxID=2831522 RepID=UPI001BA7A0B6|nr:NUDIX hydrolase [Paenibacillus sp. Marseille-Q4541]